MARPTVAKPYERLLNEFEQEPVNNEQDERREYSADYDRVLYSTAFRRLSYVTQVVGQNETGLFHNRLVHSLKVAQTGRRVANRLCDAAKVDRNLRALISDYGGLDPRVIHTACIAHDLGHPPFGHVAELAMQGLLASNPDARQESLGLAPQNLRKFTLPDSFEGNAQTFRILTRLAFREPYFNIVDPSASADERTGLGPALNLTKRTLAAVQKYPWRCRERPHGIDAKKAKWGAYDSEKRVLEWALDGIVGREVDFHGKAKWEYRSIEAQIMDWSDDIAYAVHDIEDFFRAGLIPLDLIARSRAHFEEYFRYAWDKVRSDLEHAVSEEEVREWLNEVRSRYLPRRAYSGTRWDREQLHMLASKLIRGATEGVEIVGEGLVLPSKKQLAIIEMLKQLTWYYVIDSLTLSSIRHGHYQLVRELYGLLLAWVEHEYGSVGQRNLPARLVEYLDVSTNELTENPNYDENQRISRAVADYLASLTESQAIELTHRLAGRTQRSIFEAWLHI